MNRLTRALADTAAKALFRTGEVTEVVRHGTRFRSIELAGTDLTKTTWSVGDKLQVRTDPEQFVLRTYTPISWDTARGATRLLVHLHGEGPGAAWANRVAVGDRCQFFGPRGSLRLADLGDSVVFAGDETSFALVAAWHRLPRDRPTHAAFFEVDDPDESRDVLGAVGLDPAGLFRRAERASHLDRFVEGVVTALRADPAASVCLTGRAQTIAILRRAIKDAGLADRPVRVKAYWDENRTGLD